jgi:hypothetical protein
MNRRDTLRVLGTAGAASLGTRSVALAEESRPATKPYRSFAIASDGSRIPIDARRIVVSLGPDQEIEIDLAAPIGLAGGLSVQAGTNTSQSELQKKGIHSTLVVRPSASNALHLFVENRHGELVDLVKRRKP